MLTLEVAKSRLVSKYLPAFWKFWPILHGQVVSLDLGTGKADTVAILLNKKSNFEVSKSRGPSLKYTQGLALTTLPI